MAGLLSKWQALAARVPLHFSRGGTYYGDKHVLIGVVLLPLVLYLALPLLAPRNAAAAASYRSMRTGTAVALSLLLTTLVLAGIPNS